MTWRSCSLKKLFNRSENDCPVQKAEVYALWVRINNVNRMSGSERD
jgi:hypothetical protein